MLVLGSPLALRNYVGIHVLLKNFQSKEIIFISFLKIYKKIGAKEYLEAGV